MTINIEKDLKGAVELQGEALLQDRSQDGNLTVSDFVPLYGQTVSADFYSEIEKSLLQHDLKGFRDLLGEMKEARNRRFASLFRPFLQEAGKYGVIMEDDQVDFSKVPYEQNQAVKDILTSGLDQIFQNEFPYPKPGKTDEITDGCFAYIFTEARPLALVGLAQYIFDSPQRYACFVHFNGELAQMFYAEQPAALRQLAAKFWPLEVMTHDKKIGKGEVDILEKVLTKLRDSRPDDFKKISRITLFQGSSRGGAYTHKDGKIDLYAPFGATTKSSYKGDSSYAEDWKLLFENASTEEYLLNTLFHETGHLLFGPGETFFYGERVPQMSETFAEDYRIFFLSNGKRVAARNERGAEIPAYQERLNFFIGRFATHR